MLTLSKPISAGQPQAYHKSEFANAKENYYTEGERVRGEWQGQLAYEHGQRSESNPYRSLGGDIRWQSAALDWDKGYRAAKQREEEHRQEEEEYYARQQAAWQQEEDKGNGQS